VPRKVRSHIGGVRGNNFEAALDENSLVVSVAYQAQIFAITTPTDFACLIFGTPLWRTLQWAKEAKE